MKHIVLFLGLVGMVAASGPASAYSRTMNSAGTAMRWGHNPGPLLLYTKDLPEPLTKDIFVRAVIGAADAWSAPTVSCSGIDLLVDERDEAEGKIGGKDRENRVTFRTTRWCQDAADPGTPEICYPSAALAITTVWARPTTGEIVDADVEINGVLHPWTDLVTNPNDHPLAHDLQNTLTHEFGHVLGFDHSCWTIDSGRPVWKDHTGADVVNCNEAPSSVRETTMLPEVVRGDLSRRDLAADDMLAVCEVYPPGGFPPPAGGGGCSVVPHPPAGAIGFGLIVFLAAMALGVRRRLLHRAPRR